MDYYAGIDVSLECSSVCVVEATGKIFREGKGRERAGGTDRVVRFAWTWACADRAGGGTVVAMAVRGAAGGGPCGRASGDAARADAFKAMPVKSDRNDARGIAQLMRLGWFRPVHCKSMEAQEIRAVLTARKLVQSKLRDIENSLRGMLRGFGLKVGQDNAEAGSRGGSGSWWPAIRGWKLVAKALLEAHAVLRREFNGFEKRMRKLARPMRRQAVDVDAGRGPDRGAHLRLARSTIQSGSVHRRQTGAHFGLTPKKYQSGQTDYTGRISKIGDASVREALYQAAHVMLTKPVKGCSALKSWAHADRQTRGHAQGQGGVRAQARRHPASHARRRKAVQPASRPRPRRPHNEEINGFRAGHDTRLSRSEVPRWDDGSGQAAIREVGTQTTLP